MQSISFTNWSGYRIPHRPLAQIGVEIMKVLLTSFGFTNERYHLGSIYGSYGYKHADRVEFHRLPPFSIAEIERHFEPDYSLLLLCDEVIVDTRTMEALKNPHESWILTENRKEQIATTESGDWVIAAYKSLYDTLRILHDEGFVSIVDYNAILQDKSDVLDAMLAEDLKQLSIWVNPLIESLHVWSQYVDALRAIFYSDNPSETGSPRKDFNSPEMYDLRARIHNQSCISRSISFLQYLLSEQSDKSALEDKYLEDTQQVLADYLRYLNGNIVLASSLDAGFHDWSDYQPLYKQKFATMLAKEPPTERRIEEIQKLFTLVLPRLAIRDYKNLLRILKDKRIHDIRSLITDAVEGNLQIDQSFANRVLMDVLEQEYQTACVKSLIGYITLPLGMLPIIGTPLGKIAEEISDRIAAKAIRKKHQWFYLLSNNVFKESHSEWYKMLSPWK